MSRMLRNTTELLDWMRTNGDRVGLVVRRGDDGAVCHNEDGFFPLAAARVVLVLGAYAEAVAQRRVDPDELVPLPEVQDWWVRATDSGAHMDAERDWRKRDRVVRGPVLQVPLDEVVNGMIRWSSNACADYLLDRFGGDVVTDWARRRGLSAQQPVYSMYGELDGWFRHGEGWAALTPAERTAEMTRPRPESRKVSRWRVNRLGARRQAVCATVSCAGTPREWAALLDRVHTNGAGMARGEAAVMRRHLGWPREVSERNAQRFGVFESKAGSFAGVLTEVSYAVPVDGPPCLVVQFYRDLPVDAWNAMTRSLVHQRLVLELATGERSTGELAEALAG